MQGMFVMSKAVLVDEVYKDKFDFSRGRVFDLNT